MDEHAGQIRTVIARVQHQELESGAHALKIGAQTAQVSTENLAPLDAKLSGHSRGEPGLGAEELRIAGVEQVHHGPIALN